MEKQIQQARMDLRTGQMNNKRSPMEYKAYGSDGIHSKLHPTMNTTTIVIVDDHLLLRQTWSFVLKNTLEYEVVWECSNAQDAIQMVALLQPDIIILDINLPGMSGLEAVPRLLKASPMSKILGISMHKHPAFATRMIREGAMGYVSKSSSAKEMFTALSHITKGKKYLCQEVKDELTNEIFSDQSPKDLPALSRREFEIIGLIKQGLSSKMIADKLSISVKTVEVHRYHILQKLKLKNSAAMVNFINKNNFEKLL